jgi:hypothetical protein
MSGYRIVFVQSRSADAQAQAQARAQAQADAQAPAPHAPQAVPTREQIRDQIRHSIEDATRAAEEAGKQTRISVDRRGVTVIDGQLAEPILAPGMPGVTIHGSGMQDVIPPQAVDISIAFFIMMAVIIIGWPLARAFGRRLERRGEVSTGADPALTGQLQRIEQAVEAMSIEIERISESQRFLTKLQSSAAPERTALGAGERR